MLRKFCCAFLVIFSLFCAVECFKIQPRIVDGTSSKRGQFPFFALLRIAAYTRQTGQEELICGGTLMNNRYVLTAGHCLFDAESVQVDLGSLEKDNENEKGRKSFISSGDQLIIHPDYNNETLAHDIAIIHLGEPVTFSDVIQPVWFSNKCNISVDDNFIAIGNGIYNDQDELAPTLQYTELTTISSALCKDIFPDIDPSTVFCADGPNGGSICSGDSGGPLIHATDRTLYGVTSFQDTLGCQVAPQGFANVMSYRPWISKVTGIYFHDCN